MIRVLSLALLMFSFINSNSLKCVHLYNSVKKAGNNFQLYFIKDHINKLTTSKDEMCAVEIKIFYKSRRIEISFDETFKPNDLIINFHMRMITSVIADTAKTIDLINILQFACNNTDQCDRYFFLGHIDWLFDATYDKLVNTTVPLLLKNTRAGIAKFNPSL